MNDLTELWKVALAQIEVKIDSPAQFKTWFKNTELKNINFLLIAILISCNYNFVYSSLAIYCIEIK